MSTPQLYRVPSDLVRQSFSRFKPINEPGVTSAATAAVANAATVPWVLPKRDENSCGMVVTARVVTQYLMLAGAILSDAPVGVTGCELPPTSACIQTFMRVLLT